MPAQKLSHDNSDDDLTENDTVNLQTDDNSDNAEQHQNDDEEQLEQQQEGEQQPQEDEEHDEEREEEDEKEEKQVQTDLDQSSSSSSDDGSNSDINTNSKKKEEFIVVRLSDIRKEVQCPICLGIIRKTRTVMECLHRFCRECIDKSMRLGNNECPACRTHCASRRSLRDDPNYDSLIAALYPDIDQYEEEELAFQEDERVRNKQIQAAIAQTFRRQTEALTRKRRRSQGNYRKRSNYRSEDDDDANGHDGGKDSSSADERGTEAKPKRLKRWRGQPSSAAGSGDGGGDENDQEVLRDSGIAPAGLVGNSEMLAWGKGGIRSNTRYGSGSGRSVKHGRSRLGKLNEHLRNLDENEDELDIHLVLVPLDEQKVPVLRHPYLSVRPALSVGQLCEFVAIQTSVPTEAVEILARKGLYTKLSTFTPTQDISGPSVFNSCKDDLQVLDPEETLAGLKAACDFLKRGASRKSNPAQKKARRIAGDVRKPDLSNVVGLPQTQREEGDRELVNFVLMKFDAVRRRLSQLEDSKEASTGLIRRADLKAGNIMLTAGFRTNSRKRIGVVPGVEIGDIFFFRMELCAIGLHAPSMAGIDYMSVRGEMDDEPLAVSIVSSGGYDDDADDQDVLVYTGHGGGNYSGKGKETSDQKLERGNLALERSSRRANQIRVIRGIRDTVNPNTKVYVYDGLYTIQDSWIDKGKSGTSTFKYKLVRIPGQPSAFAVWQSVLKWKENVSSRSGLILPDLTSGGESLPVSLVNDVDDEKGPGYFTYLRSVRYTKSFNLAEPSYGCNCHSACAAGNLNCSCIRKNGGDFPYTANSVLVSRKPLLYECGPSCPCFPNCKNRVSQGGLKVRLEVFRTKDRGWGLRSWDAIRSGTYICEYAGEVIDKAKYDRDESENNDYIFDSSRTFDKSIKWNYDPPLVGEASADLSEDYDIPTPLIINAKDSGNIARFMNHSCSPNVLWQPIVYEQNGDSFIHVGFFAMRHIPPMTELTFDYGISQSEHRRKRCLCGSPKCKGYFS